MAFIVVVFSEICVYLMKMIAAWCPKFNVQQNIYFPHHGT